MTIRLGFGGAAAIFLGCALFAGTAFAAGSGLGIRHSVHDFTDNNGAPENNDGFANAWNNKRKEICRVCHVPHDHGAVRYGNQGILWNHQTTTKTNWQMYASDPTMLSWIDGTVEASPSGTSKLCLGCHDGVSAINQYDGKTPSDAGYGNGAVFYMDTYAAGFVIGDTSASLTNNPPLSVTYAYGTDPQLKDPSTATMANGDTVASLLDNDRIECATCHDVHDREAVPLTHLLRQSTAGADVTGAGASALCLVCHDK